MCCGIGVALWLLGPSLSFPAMTEARSGSALSPGLDTLRALGLTVTGVLLFRGDPRRLLVAAATAASLVVGAWLGVLTASPGTGRATALTTALGAELPLATLCVVVTVRCLTRRDTAAGRRGSGRRDPLHPEPPGPSS
jgi:hypothetical protein